MDDSDTLPPDGIPQDVMEAARPTYDELFRLGAYRDAPPPVNALAVIARAIMAERERCSKVAYAAAAAAIAGAVIEERERCAKIADPIDSNPSWLSNYEKQAIDIRLNIAAAIRGADA